MSETYTDPTPTGPSGEDPADRDERLLVGLTYVLFLIGNIIGVTSIIGVVIAYVRRENAPAWLQSHYTFQIRTFWVSLIGVVVFGILTLILIGFVGLLVVWLWLLIRSVVGLLRVIERQQIDDPRSFWI